MLDWLVQRDCNLTQVGGLVDNKGYGIATPKGSRWKDKISKAILLLQEKSAIQVRMEAIILLSIRSDFDKKSILVAYLDLEIPIYGLNIKTKVDWLKIDFLCQMLYNKWWTREKSSMDCPTKTMEDLSKASALNIVNIGGVFVVLLCGLAMAILVALIESIFCFGKKDAKRRQTARAVDCSTFVGNCSEFYKPSKQKSLENNFGSCDSCNAVRGTEDSIRYI